MTAPSEPLNPAHLPHVSIADYVRVGILLTAFSVALVFVTGTSQPPPAAEAMLAPVVALAGLTAVVWFVMVVFRTGSLLRGVTQAEYYRDYRSHAPPDWVERPARTFNNLFQVPVLFYLACVLILVTRRIDQAQLHLAWIYVLTRTVHAILYIGWNNVAYRFAVWSASCITLGVLWVRFVVQTWPSGAS